MDTTSYRLPADLIADVERLAEERGVSKSELVREALGEYVRRSHGERKLDRVAVLDAILGPEPEGLGIRDLSQRAEDYLRAGLGRTKRPPRLPAKSTAKKPIKSSAR